MYASHFFFVQLYTIFTNTSKVLLFNVSFSSNRSLAWCRDFAGRSAEGQLHYKAWKSVEASGKGATKSCRPKGLSRSHSLPPGQRISVFGCFPSRKSTPGSSKEVCSFSTRGINTIFFFFYKLPFCYYYALSLYSYATFRQAFSYRKVDKGSLTCTTILRHAVHTKARQAPASLRKCWPGRAAKVTHPAECRSRVLATGFAVQCHSQLATPSPYNMYVCTYVCMHVGREVRTISWLLRSRKKGRGQGRDI